MKKIKDFTDSDILMLVFYGFVHPHYDYCYEVSNSIGVTIKYPKFNGASVIYITLHFGSR